MSSCLKVEWITERLHFKSKLKLILKLFYTGVCSSQMMNKGGSGGVTFFLDFVIKRPHVPCQWVGAALDGPGGEGELASEQVGVGLGVVHPEGLQVALQSLQSVGARAQQDVAERTLSGGYVGGQEVPLHLQKQGRNRMMERTSFPMFSIWRWHFNTQSGFFQEQLLSLSVLLRCFTAEKQFKQYDK